MNQLVNNQYDKTWGPFTAGTLMAAVPVALLFFALQKLDRQRPDRRVGEGMRATAARSTWASLLTEPYHDGSELYVSSGDGEPAVRPSPGRRRARPRRSSCASCTTARPASTRQSAEDRTERDWWAARFALTGSRTTLPLAALGRRGRVRVGERHRACTTTTSRTPTTSSTRPAAGGPGLAPRLGRLRDLPRPLRDDGARRSSTPDWAVPRAWDDAAGGPQPRTRRASYFGGDLRGRRGSISTTSSALGANVIYLTPFFPAGSTHRYDSTTFEPRRPAARRRRGARVADRGGARARDAA